jgi:trigger factor
LNIETVRQEDHQAKITVEFPQTLFEGYKRRAAKKISSKIKIPGFRPGKAPYNVVVSNYGEATVIQEAIDLLLDELYPQILDQAEINPSGPGHLESIESYDPPIFVFMVPLEPEVQLGDYREIRKDYELEPFDVTEVDDFIDNLRRNAATIIPSEEAADEGDLVYFTLSGEWLNPKEEEDATITDKTPQQTIIPAEDAVSEDEWPYPGFSRELLGVTAGDTKEIQHAYPDDHPDEDMQGRTAIFSVEVQSVKELELPEFDEEFVETLGDYDSPEAFRETIEARLQEDHQARYDRIFFNELLDEISETTEMKYPRQMLEHEAEHVLEDIKARLQRQNLDFETYLKIRETDEETFMEEEVNPVARERLERSLLIDALVEAEELKIDQEALQSQVNEILTELFYSGNYQEMQKEMGQEELTRAISREGVARTMNAQIQERLKLIATGQPIPEDEPEPEENTDAEPAEDAGDMEQPESATADDTEGDEAGSSEESTAAQDEEKTDQEESEGEEHADES